MDSSVRLAAAFEVCAAGLELLAHPAETNAEAHAATRKSIERGHALRQRHGVVRRQNEDSGCQSEFPGATCNECEKIDRVRYGAVIG